MLTPSWTPLRYHAMQSAAWRTKARFVGIAAGRGSGKTELARRRIVRFLPIERPWPDPVYIYALPTFNQAKRIAWGKLKALVPDRWIAKTNESELSIHTIFGSELRVMGMDKPHRAEGEQIDGIVMDESCDQKPGTFDRTVRPMLTHRKAWAWRIGVPKRFGVGAREFREFHQRCMSGEFADHAGFWWPSEDIIDPTEIANAKATMDERDYREQFGASWETIAGRIFYSFDVEGNVDDAVVYDETRPILVGSDFNVDPMAWVLCQQNGTELHQFDEIWLRDTNTQATLDYLWDKYGQKHRGGWQFFGDASGRARRSSATTSDYIQIRSDMRFNGRVFYPQANPSIHARFSSCNALFKNANGVRRFKVHPRCKHTIEDLLDRGFEPGSREPADDGDVGHISDALGYLIYRKFPPALITHEFIPSVST